MSLQPHRALPPVTPASATEFTEAWLANRRLSEHTRAAYRRDVATWLTWCAGRTVRAHRGAPGVLRWIRRPQRSGRGRRPYR
ncbi:site-specific integrase, partial [Actinoplanes philippinensis]|uniref:site-specific integrase n=1 Tax=Actinoplanes philippinensis TaxID=35752 RepID=UPI0033CE5857